MSSMHFFQSWRNALSYLSSPLFFAQRILTLSCSVYTIITALDTCFASRDVFALGLDLGPDLNLASVSARRSKTLLRSSKRYCFSSLSTSIFWKSSDSSTPSPLDSEVGCAAIKLGSGGRLIINARRQMAYSISEYTER